MMIHTVISQRRRALGLTQEQVADVLGVTTPAVNKWEKGGSCPDIALLPPLARLLKTDLNTLFGFYEEITQQEVIRLCGEVNEAALTQGIDAGFAAAEEKIREYPNSDTQLDKFAPPLHVLLATAGLEDDEASAYWKIIDAWYEQLSQSEEGVIRDGVNFMLASRAIGEGEYDKAQEHLDRMPNRDDIPDKKMLQAGIYLAQNRAGEAAALLERTLLVTITEVQMILYKLIDANAALGEMDKAAYVAERTAKLAEIFDLNAYNMALPAFLLAVANEDTGRTVALLREMFDAMSSAWGAQESPLYSRCATNDSSATLERMIGPLVQAVRQEPRYAYLQADEEFQALIREIEEKLAAQ